MPGIAPAMSINTKEVATVLAAKRLPFFHPPEFELSLFAEGLGGPRVIAFDPAGTMLVSIPAAGLVAALPDDDDNGRADRIIHVAEGLKRPHGLAFRCKEKECRLYIAETDRVSVFDYDQTNREAHNGRKLVELPGEGGHSTRTILFLPPPLQDSLLIAIGSSCNVCEESDWRRAAILLAEGEGGNLRPFARGLRNAVFMRLHPESGEVWATEMGRDFLGDDLPPDEINIIRDGHDYGWPYCYGRNQPDHEFTGSAEDPSCRSQTPSHIDIQAHAAPLGLDFFPSEGWPEKYQGSLLVAFHGSWNRSMPIGYKVTLFRLAPGGEYIGQEDFITGWLTDKNTSLGRPVDIRILPGGVLYISDDKAGVIYRLTLRPGSPRAD
ncbi:MAG: PQQ-dependent sugar dehydrogenase [Desulfobulbaceae bacterium]